MTTPDLNRLSQACAQLDPNYRDYLDDTQCTQEQSSHVVAVAQYIHSELKDIRRELHEFLDSVEINKGLDW